MIDHALREFHHLNYFIGKDDETRVQINALQVQSEKVIHLR